MGWLKTLSRFLSDIAWRVGLEALSLKLLLFSLEAAEDQPRIYVYNDPTKTVVLDPEPKTVFEDSVLVAKLQPWQAVSAADPGNALN